ncbi:hypothetical protein B0J11DRAFT_23163 [Dendryphion nanum]|uniref:Uncharacterized protein n=1 Tax=Dendryphion nanum TaxID=256645 RepID=A0A9P9J0B5_9PLEO|nr:hypothetical protein B0J11DRAFT_23163 [Dendryphion nanum]
MNPFFFFLFQLALASLSSAFTLANPFHALTKRADDKGWSLQVIMVQETETSKPTLEFWRGDYNEPVTPCYAPKNKQAYTVTGGDHPNSDALGNVNTPTVPVGTWDLNVQVLDIFSLGNLSICVVISLPSLRSKIRSRKHG